MPYSQVQVGPQQAYDGATVNARADRQGAQIFTQLHARYAEQNLRGKLWSDGMGLTAITNAIWTTGTTDATSKGIVGVYNPPTSGVNVIVLQAFVGVTITAATCTGGGPYVWVKSTGETAISTGTAPINSKTLGTTGPDGPSNVKGMCGIAMTGKVNALAVVRASSLCGGSSANFSFVGTAAGQATPQVTSVELIDGLFIVPPGGIIALQATTTPVAHSAVGGIVWEEIPV